MFTLSSADDQVVHDPRPEVVAAVIQGLPAGGDAFAILASDADKLTFIQAIGSPSEGFSLEYQDGSLDRHFECANQETRGVTASRWTCFSAPSCPRSGSASGTR